MQFFKNYFSNFFLCKKNKSAGYQGWYPDIWALLYNAQLKIKRYSIERQAKCLHNIEVFGNNSYHLDNMRDKAGLTASVWDTLAGGPPRFLVLRGTLYN